MILFPTLLPEDSSRMKMIQGCKVAELMSIENERERPDVLTFLNDQRR